MDGKPYPLPERWAESSIGKVVVRTKQRDPRKNPDEVFHYVDVSAVSNTSFKITGAAPTLGSEAPSRARKAIETDDVLFATVRPTLKRIALVPSALDGAIASTGYCVLRCDKTKAEPQFLYSFLITDHFNARMAGLERGASYPAVRDSDVTASWFPLPPLPEQKKIAHILSTVQRAIEAQERIIQTTTELKKALMHKLFTEGLRNEPQKQTEIGTVPESWEVVELGTLFEKQPQNGIYKHKRDYGSGTQILRIDDFSNDGDVVTRAGNLVTLDRSGIETYGLESGDIVINRVNSLSHLGKTALIGEIGDEMVFESNMMRFSVDESQVLKKYVFKFLNSPLTKKQIIGTAKRAVAQSSINQGDVKSIIVPKPSLEEQGEIVAALDATEAKIAHSTDKAAVLRDLFRTLIHELMTAKTRVHEPKMPC
ncbi:MAG: hypothetical protein B7X93_01185 [Hydrogenophilales bacterium 17-61-9]|nr:MAG: hypothetical protein B7X93_01185 [Hydrogenophilales bacterium 17-61-9]